MRIKDVSEKLGLIMDKQNDIIRKLTAAPIGEEIMAATKTVAEKLKHTMFMVQ